MPFLPSLKSGRNLPERKTANLSYVSFIGGSGQPYSSNWPVDRAVSIGMQQSVWVFRAVHAIASNAAGLPFTVRQGHPASGDVVNNHPLLTMFNQYPNDFEDSFSFRYRLSAQILLSRMGAFIQLQRNRRGDLISMGLLPPGAVSPIPDPETYVSGYLLQTGNTRVVIPPDEVLWIKLPHPTDPYSGMTPLEAAGLSVEGDILARQFNRNFLQNDGRPGGILAVKGGMEDDDAELLRNKFLGPSAAGNGPQGAGRLTVLETGDGGIDFIDTSSTPRDAQWTDMQKANKEAILIAFGTPEAVIGNASGRCVDSRTEALTMRGWLRGDEITTDDFILSCDPADGRLKWGPVREVYRNDHYSGPMYRLKHSHADFLVTPGHKWLVEKRAGQGKGPRGVAQKEWVKDLGLELKKVEDIGENDKIIAMGHAENSNWEAIFSSAFVELVGWTVTEGYCQPNEWTLTNRPGLVAAFIRLRQSAKNPDCVERIRACLKETGARFIERTDVDRPEMYRWDIRGAVAEAVLAVAPAKIMSMRFIRALTAEQREMLLHVMMDADGIRQPGVTKSWVFGQKSKEMAEAFGILANLSGYSTSMRHERSGTDQAGDEIWRWRVTVRDRKKMSFRPTRQQKTIEHYEGMVWCPRTDYGTFVCRRQAEDGMLYVASTGNTYDNAGVETEVFWRETMLPHLSLIARPLDRTAGQGLFAGFDTTSIYILDRDKRQQYSFYLEEFKAGVISVDGYLNKTGQEKIGDEHRYISNLYVQYDDQGEATIPVAPDAGSPTPVSPAALAEPSNVIEIPRLAESTGTGIPSLMPVRTAASADPTLDARIRSWEHHVAKQMEVYFRRQERVVMEKMTARKARDRWGTKELTVNDFFDLTRWNEQLQDDSRDWLEVMAKDFGVELPQGIHAAVLAENDRTAEFLDGFIAKAAKAGVDLDVMVAEARKVFTGAIQGRAEKIAASVVSAISGRLNRVSVEEESSDGRIDSDRIG